MLNMETFPIQKESTGNVLKGFISKVSSPYFDSGPQGLDLLLNCSVRNTFQMQYIPHASFGDIG